MITVQVAGNVGKADAEIRTTRGGKEVVSFSVAGSGWSEGKEKTEWFNCSYWGDQALNVAKFIKAGSAITVSGTLSTREWEAKDGRRTALELRVEKLKLQGGRRDDDQGEDRGERRGNSDKRQAGKPAFDQDLDDEIPF
jgi:single-strand DNA-binding protein